MLFSFPNLLNFRKTFEKYLVLESWFPPSNPKSENRERSLCSKRGSCCSNVGAWYRCSVFQIFLQLTIVIKAYLVVKTRIPFAVSITRRLCSSEKKFRHIPEIRRSSELAGFFGIFLTAIGTLQISQTDIWATMGIAFFPFPNCIHFSVLGWGFFIDCSNFWRNCSNSIASASFLWLCIRAFYNLVHFVL